MIGFVLPPLSSTLQHSSATMEHPHMLEDTQLGSGFKRQNTSKSSKLDPTEFIGVMDQVRANYSIMFGVYILKS